MNEKLERYALALFGGIIGSGIWVVIKRLFYFLQRFH